MLLLTESREVAGASLAHLGGAQQASVDILAERREFACIVSFGEDFQHAVELVIAQDVTRAVATVVRNVERFVALRNWRLLGEFGRIEAVLAARLGEVGENLVANLSDRKQPKQPVAKARIISFFISGYLSFFN